MTTHELASAVLTLISHDDAQTIAELHAALRCSVARLRVTLQDLVDAEVIGTTRLGRSVGYVLLEGGEAAAPQPVEMLVTAEVADQRAERSSTASLVLAAEDCPIWTEATHESVMGNGTRIEFRRSNLGPGWASRAVMPHCTENWVFFGPELPRSAKPIAPPQTTTRSARAARRVIPVTLDLVAAMTETQKRLLDGETLAELSARTVHPLRREVLPTELQATREDAERDQWGAEQDASIAQRAKRQLVGSGVLLLVTIAPVLWLLSHLA